MPEAIDIKARAECILSQGRLVEIEALHFDRGVFDAADADGVIDGDMGCGTSAKGRKSLIVQRDVLGAEGKACRLTFGGDVVVIGDVHHAQISAQNIWIGGSADHCRLTCAHHIGVAGTLATSELLVGDLGRVKRKIDFGQEKIQKHRDELAHAERKLHLEERHLDRLVKSTQFNLNFTIGGLLTRGRNRVVVNLKRFYQALTDRSPEAIDHALAEFYGKAVVGLLTRSNRHLIQNNPNRRKVFMGLIRALYDLFMLTRECDRLRDEARSWEAIQKNMVEEIGAGHNRVFIGAGIAPDLQFKFIVPEVDVLDDGTVTLLSETAGIQILSGNNPLSLNVIQMPIAREGVRTNCDTDAFHQAVLHVVDGGIVWAQESELEIH